jgi:hypothetical protein
VFDSVIFTKTLFIVPTDAHYYKNHKMLKQFTIKIITLAPTCFGSRRNHHQGAVLCLAKTTNYGFFCARRCRNSQCYGGISACSAGVQFTAWSVFGGICRQTPTTHIISTFEPLYVISFKYRLLFPDDGSYVVQNMLE